MAQKHLEEVIKASGLPEDQVKTLLELPDDAPDFKPDTYVAPIRTNVETAVKNDPKFYEGLNKANLPKEFLEQITRENYGATAATVRHHMMKAVGMSEKDFADLGEEGKKMEIFTPAFVKKLSDGKVGDKELQTKLMEANTELEKLKAGMPDIEKKFEEQYNAKVTDLQFATAVNQEVASVQGLKVAPKFLTTDVVNHLKAKFAFVVENGVVELRQKDKPTLKVLTDNGTKELTLSRAVNEYLEAEGAVDKKKGTTKETITTEVVTDKTGGLKMSSNVSDKVKKRMEEDAKAGGTT